MRMPPNNRGDALHTLRVARQFSPFRLKLLCDAFEQFEEIRPSTIEDLAAVTQLTQGFVAAFACLARRKAIVTPDSVACRPSDLSPQETLPSEPLTPGFREILGSRLSAPHPVDDDDDATSKKASRTSPMPSYAAALGLLHMGDAQTPPRRPRFPPGEARAHRADYPVRVSASTSETRCGQASSAAASGMGHMTS